MKRNECCSSVAYLCSLINSSVSNSPAKLSAKLSKPLTGGHISASMLRPSCRAPRALSCLHDQKQGGFMIECAIAARAVQQNKQHGAMGAAGTAWRGRQRVRGTHTAARFPAPAGRPDCSLSIASRSKAAPSRSSARDSTALPICPGKCCRCC